MTVNDSASAAPAAFFGWPPRNDDGSAPALSVVVPMFNEADGAAALIREISGALAEMSFEIVAVDDGSTDETRAALVAEKKITPQLRVIAHAANAGQSRAIRSGVIAARAPVIAIFDGDGQYDPADIVLLYRKLIRITAPRKLAMVAGERRDRRDAAIKRWASRVANLTRARFLGDGAADAGCGLKAFYREAYLRLPAFDHMHRYLPALARREGYAVEFAPVRHRPRLHGRSKYANLGRLAAALCDLPGAMWLNKRARSPNEISEL